MLITSKSDSEDLRIYFDGILHIRIPRDKNLKLHSWIEGHSKKFFIKVHCDNHSELYEYDNKELWVSVLKVFNEII